MAPRDGYRLDTYVERVWLPHMRARVEEGDRLRPRTLDEYEKVWSARVRPVLGHRRLSELRAPDATLLIAELREHRTQSGNPLSPATLKRALFVLTSIVAFAESDEGGQVCPVGTAASMKPRLPDARPKRPRISQDEVRRVMDVLLADARQAEPPAAVLPALLVVSLGVRRGEACGALRSAWGAERRALDITVSLTEFSDGTLVPGEPKTQNGVRRLPVPVEVAEVIDAFLARRPFSVYLAEPTKASLGTPVRPSRLSTYLRGAARRAGVSEAAEGAHAYRRAAADRLLAGGVDHLLVGRYLGHGSARLVDEVYAGDQADRVVALADVLALPVRNEAV
jgi:integrase